ncbi:unnamed protein product [Lactuca saligna]|uniref:RRM domain-containing protein n=1 Tax=Lactuca saligna TaxID=75948 RepID=A0AA36A2R5_LACSI|nr:unnamed protein product [Lactuca saligna]
MGAENPIEGEEIRKEFLRYGNVSDVYYQGRKGKNGQFYLFIRFLDVEDKLALENKIDGVTHRGRRLSINLEKHPRGTMASKTSNNRREQGVSNENQTQNFRDARMFAEVARHRTLHHHHDQVSSPLPPSHIITISPDTETSHRLRKISVVGEAISLDHLGHMRSLMHLKETPSFKIKYIGGLKILLVFKDSTEAKEFMENRRRWEDYMKWVKPREHECTMKYERIAWIRITWLPLQYWGEKNFSAIATQYGVIIAPYDDLPNRVDMSHFDPISNPYVEDSNTVTDSDEDMDSDDEISDTWILGNNNDLEEGEIEMENTDDQTNGGDAYEIPPCEEYEQPHGELTPIKCNSKYARVAVNNNSQREELGQMDERRKNGDNGLPRITEPIGLLHNGCFGPFSSNWIDNLGNLQFNSLPQFNIGGSTLKRHRTDGDTSRFSVNNIRPMADLESETNYETFVPPVPPPNENAAPMGDNEARTSIDLNRGLMENSQIESDQEPSDCVSSSLEAEKTTIIGKQLGFDIEMDNPILAEVLGDVGANTVH